MNGWRWLLIYLSAQLAQSETAVNLLSVTIFCLYCGILPGFYWFYSILQGCDERIFLSLHTKHPPVPVRCNWIVFARQMHSTTEFALTVLSKCVYHLNRRKAFNFCRGVWYSRPDQDAMKLWALSVKGNVAGFQYLHVGVCVYIYA